MNHVTQPLSSADISIFLLDCYIKTFLSVFFWLDFYINAFFTPFDI